MPNDVPDWTQNPTVVKRLLGTVGGAAPVLGTPTFTVAASGMATKSILLPDGCTGLRFNVNASGVFFEYELLVVGHNSGTQYFGDDLSPGSPKGVFLPTRPLTLDVDREIDTQVDLVLINDTAAQLNVYVSATFDVETPGQSGSDASVLLVGGKAQLQFYDWQVTGSFTAAGTPSITQAAPGSGLTLVVAHLGASLISTVAGSLATPQLLLTDSIAGTVKRDYYAILAAPAAAPPYQVPGLAYVIAGAATFQWDRAIGANLFATLDMAGWFQ